jgi:hypothetical protein
MRIGFDAKRAYNNFSGLGNYSRYVISNIFRFYPENEYLLYTPRIADRDLFKMPEDIRIRQPGKGFLNTEGIPLAKLSSSPICLAMMASICSTD